MDVSRPEELAEEFFRHYYDVLMVYAMAILEDRYLAEEATQETFRTVCEHYEELEAIQYPKAWLKKILWNR